MSEGLDTKLGFGASGAWGQPWFPRKDAIRLIHEALDHGIRHFDTAGFYARGEAEERLGTALRGRDGVYISTKTGTIEGKFGRKLKDFSSKAIRIDTEDSLRRLRRDHIDTLYLHGPDYWVVEDSAPTFDELKRDGLINKAGVCGEGEALVKSVQHKTTDVIMGVFNLFDQRHRAVFTQAQAAGIQTVAIAPLAQAFYRPGFYQPSSLADGWAIARAMLKDRKKLSSVDANTRALLGSFEGKTATKIMLYYVVAHACVDIAMTTTTKPRHLSQSIEAMGMRLDEQEQAKLDALAASFSHL